MEEQNKRIPFIPIAAVVVVAIVVVAFATGGKNENKENLADVTPTPVVDGSADTTDAGTQAADDTVYKDGTYTAVGSYVSPGGPETIDITLTIKDDVITEASAKPNATLPASVNWQGVFSANFSSMIVGKPLDEVQLDHVSGSSLTPKGFNDAVAKIKTQAEA